MAFKLYEVTGYPRPLRLSAEHAQALGGRPVDEEQVSQPVAEAPAPEPPPVEDDSDEEWS